ncbi:zinc finger protein 541-like [Passer domesticus]|uniref:zinc finger protein 541-like n=1 Tax=Passer domesticus TaxID=48849 RepID=UPI0030FE46BA
MKRKARAHTEPHINVGSDFQAELPEVQTGPPSEDEEPATLVWKPLEEDNCDLEKPDRVRELLDMASSRGLPGAAAQLELALHCLRLWRCCSRGGLQQLKAIPWLIIITQPVGSASSG